MKRPIATLAACLVSLACSAGEVRYYTEDRVPDAAEVAALLAPAHRPGAAEPDTGAATRGVRMLDRLTAPHRVDAGPRERLAAVSARRDEAAPAAAPRIPSTGSVALALRFAIDDAQVLPQQRAHLDALADGIRRLPEGAVVTIAGHTDAFGPAAYNLELSLRRAMAVRTYLVQVHGIPGRLLVAVGRGESEPLNRADPFAPENRRVQVSAEYDAA